MTSFTNFSRLLGQPVATFLTEEMATLGVACRQSVVCRGESEHVELISLYQCREDRDREYRECHWFFIFPWNLCPDCKENIMVKTVLIGDQFSSEWCHISTTITLFNWVWHHNDKVMFSFSLIFQPTVGFSHRVDRNRNIILKLYLGTVLQLIYLVLFRTCLNNNLCHVWEASVVFRCCFVPWSRRCIRLWLWTACRFPVGPSSRRSNRVNATNPSCFH